MSCCSDLSAPVPGALVDRDLSPAPSIKPDNSTPAPSYAGLQRCARCSCTSLVVPVSSRPPPFWSLGCVRAQRCRVFKCVSRPHARHDPYPRSPLHAPRGGMSRPYSRIPARIQLRVLASACCLSRRTVVRAAASPDLAWLLTFLLPTLSAMFHPRRLAISPGDIHLCTRPSTHRPPPAVTETRPIPGAKSTSQGGQADRVQDAHSARR
jgi:hypothetical protein